MNPAALVTLPDSRSLSVLQNSTASRTGRRTALVPVSLRPSGRAAERRCWRVLWGAFALHVLIVWWLVR